MTEMLVRNTVRDYDHWKAIFDQQAEPARAAGLELLRLWRARDNPNDVYFLFRVADVQRAEAFLNDPASAEAGERAGVIDGELRYLEPADDQ